MQPTLYSFDKVNKNSSKRGVFTFKNIQVLMTLFKNKFE